MDRRSDFSHRKRMATRHPMLLLLVLVASCSMEPEDALPSVSALDRQGDHRPGEDLAAEIIPEPCLESGLTDCEPDDWFSCANRCSSSSSCSMSCNDDFGNSSTCGAYGTCMSCNQCSSSKSCFSGCMAGGRTTTCGQWGTCATCAPPPSGMIAYWSFDGTTGAGTSPNGTGDYPAWHHNGPVDTSGKVYGAISLDGVDDYLQVYDKSLYSPDRDTLDFGTGDFSIVFWIKTVDDFGTIVDKSQPGYDVRIGFGKLHVGLYKLGYGWGFSTNTSLNDGNWHFVAVTVDRDSSQGLRFYLDGVLDRVHDPRSSASESLTSDHDLYFGTNLHNLSGSLDELQMFSRALTATEVQAIYNAGAAGVCWCRIC